MKVRELIERLQQMEQDATVTILIHGSDYLYRGKVVKTDEVRITGVSQKGFGTTSTAILQPEDNLQLKDRA